MTMDGLTPVVDIGGNGNGGWGDWGGALIGGAIGGAVGSAWGDRRGNNCCNNGGCCNGGGNTAAFGETFIMDSLSGARSRSRNQWPRSSEPILRLSSIPCSCLTGR